MAFAEIESARIESVVGGFCRRRVPPEIHDKLRVEYSVLRHDVEIFEVWPRWDDPGEKMHTPVAKLSPQTSSLIGECQAAFRA